MEELVAAGIRVREGLLAAQAAALNPGFVKRMTKGLPYLRLKLALSLDGRTALANGRQPLDQRPAVKAGCAQAARGQRGDLEQCGDRDQG